MHDPQYHKDPVFKTVMIENDGKELSEGTINYLRWQKRIRKVY